MQCYGVGRFVETPFLTELDGGKKVCHFKLCFPEVIKGEEKDKKDWHYLPCVIWDTAAEYICKNFTEGDPIEIINATARKERWTNSKGQTRSKIVFRINKFNKI